MKRYSVVYDDLVAKWAVVDNKAAGMVIGFHEQEEIAEDAAKREEATWPETYSEAG